jgi:hypothetical protein
MAARTCSGVSSERSSTISSCLVRLFRREIVEFGNFRVRGAFVLVTLPASNGDAMAKSKRGRPTVEIAVARSPGARADTSTLNTLGIAPPDLVQQDQRFTQEIGEAAHEHGFQAVRSPSATGVDHVLAVFPEKLAGAVLDVRLLGEWTTPDDLAAIEP